MDYRFDGSISRQVLNNYLSRAITHCGVGQDGITISRTFDDDLRMFINEGAKFIGRAAFVWSFNHDDRKHFEICKERASRAHECDSDLVLQACVFECITKRFIESIDIPEWVFEAFDLPVEKRKFNYSEMLFLDGKFVNHWGLESSVQDITRLESRLWIYYRACSYIDAGYEGIHFGQVHLIGADDKGFQYWKQVVRMVRDHARQNARRHYVLCDAHTHGIEVDGEMLFDYNAFPIRFKEVPDKPMECICEEGYLDSLFGRSKGGKSPSGWYADSMPFIVEFDNFGRSGFESKPRHDSHFAWGYDEITWFALQKKSYRHEFLRYIWGWVNERYPEGWVQMPSRRGLTEDVKFTWNNPDLVWLSAVADDESLSFRSSTEGDKASILRGYYSANTPSDACPFGYGDEDVIRELFNS